MQIISGRKKKPFNVLLYGEPGAGKSTWASQAPHPIFIATDEIDELDVERFNRAVLFNYRNQEEMEVSVLGQLDMLLKEDHDYQTVVIDTIDAIEKIVHQDILDREKSDKTRSMNKAAGGYGNGFSVAADMMTQVQTKLATLRDKKNMNIIILCHSKTKVTNDPLLGDSYTEYYLSLHDKVQSLFVDWVSAVLFLAFDVSKSENDKFAYGSGDRFLYTQKKPGFVAKNRYHLPPVLEAPENVSFKPFFDGYNAYFNTKPNTANIIRSIISLTDNVEDKAVREKIKHKVKDNIDNPEVLLGIKKETENLIGIN